jgi:hypothetical protein
MVNIVIGARQTVRTSATHQKGCLACDCPAYFSNQHCYAMMVRQESQGREAVVGNLERAGSPSVRAASTCPRRPGCSKLTGKGIQNFGTNILLTIDIVHDSGKDGVDGALDGAQIFIRDVHERMRRGV